MDTYDGYDNAEDLAPPADAYDADGVDEVDVPVVLGDAAYFVEGVEEEAAIDNAVLRFLHSFHQAVRDQNLAEIQSNYDNTWNALTERFYSKGPWPSPGSVSAAINDEGRSPRWRRGGGGDGAVPRSARADDQSG